MKISTTKAGFFFCALFASVLFVLVSHHATASHNTPEALEARTMPEGKLNVAVAGGHA